MNIPTAETPNLRVDNLKRVDLITPSLVLPGIFLLGLILRLNCLDCYSLWYDEVTSVETAQRGIDGIFAYRFGWLGNQTPLHYMLVWLTTQVVDPAIDATFVRLPSAIAGALTILLVYGLGKELFGRAEGLLASLLAALSMTFLDYSQDLRPYAMLAMLTALSVYCLLVAVRTHEGRWWLAYTIAVVANMYNSYIAVTMVLPPLMLIVVWFVLRLWRSRNQNWKPLLYAGTSLLVIGLAIIPQLLHMLSVPRAYADLSRLSVAGTLSLLIVLANWFTELELGGQLGLIVSTSMLVLAIYGAYNGIRRGKGSGVAVCSLFLLVPLLTMSVLMTSNFVTQRYVLFGLPFYFLLISQALISFTRVGDKRGQAIKVVPTLLVVLAFGWGAYNYTIIDEIDGIPSRGDYRGATRYLSENAGPQDVIVFADNHALGLTAANFYWHGSPPTQVYDVRDPRIATHARKGDIYWVVSRLSPEWLKALSAPEQGWVEVLEFRDGVVLKEESQGITMVESLERMAERNEVIRPDHRFTTTLRGCVHQAKGDVAQAIASYRLLGATSNPVLAREYLRTAEGFDVRGDRFESWREATISKFMHPASPELHTWMAKQLEEEGYSDQSRIELQIADALEAQR